MMYGWHDGWGWGAWLAMGLMMLAFWTLVVVVIIAVVRTTRHKQPPAAFGHAPDERASAQRILDERFARGEIDTDEYTRRRDLLRS